MHYNGDYSYLFADGKEIIKFKAKDSEIEENPIGLGNISKGFSESNMKKTGLYGSVYYFSIELNAVTVDNILDIHDYLYKNMLYNINVWAYQKNIYFSIDIF